MSNEWQPCPNCCEPRRVELFRHGWHEAHPTWCEVCRQEEKRRANRERVSSQAALSIEAVYRLATQPYPKVAKPSQKARRLVARD